MIFAYYLIVINHIHVLKRSISNFSSLRPVVLEPYEPADDADGYPEKNLPKKSSDYYKAREVCWNLDISL